MARRSYPGFETVLPLTVASASGPAGTLSGSGIPLHHAAWRPQPALLQEGMAEVLQEAERAGEVLDRLRDFVRGGEYRRSAASNAYQEGIKMTQTWPNVTVEQASTAPRDAACAHRNKSDFVRDRRSHGRRAVETRKLLKNAGLTTLRRTKCVQSVTSSR